MFATALDSQWALRTIALVSPGVCRFENLLNISSMIPTCLPAGHRPCMKEKNVRLKWKAASLPISPPWYLESQLTGMERSE
jgi:hypothetical protein